MVERIIIDPLKTNCYLYSVGKNKCVIIDPGGEEKEIIAKIEMLNMIPLGIIFTHGHFDHTAGAGRLKEFYEKRDIELKLAIHERDSKYLGNSAKEMNRRDFKAMGFDMADFSFQIFDSLPEPDIILHESDTPFDSDLTVIETPGHTEGSICLYSEAKKILFTGDTLFFEGIGRADLPGGDEETLIESIKQKLLTLPLDTRVFPGHGPYTTIEREIQGNPFIT